MTKLGLISTAAIMLGVTQAYAAAPVVPALRVHASAHVETANFGSCYMDYFMKPQRYATRNAGAIGGAVILFFDVAFGAVEGVYASGYCLMN